MQKEKKLRKFILIVPIIAILIIVGVIFVSRKSDVVNLAKTDEEEIKAITSADGKWFYSVIDSTNKKISVYGYNTSEIDNIVLDIPSTIDGYTVTKLDEVMLWADRWRWKPLCNRNYYSKYSNRCFGKWKKL